MDFTWTQFVREVVAERFRVTEYLGVEGDCGLFAAQAEDGRDILLRLVPESSPAAADMETRWSLAASAAHPHLQAALSQGRLSFEGTGFVYIANEKPDDRVSEVLLERPLTSGEAKPVLQAVLAVLQHLHSKSLLHGSVEPSSVLAVGDQIKLSNETLAPAPENTGERQAAIAHELEGVGFLITSLFRPFGNDGRTILPAPYSELVRLTAGNRAATTSAEDLSDLLNGRNLVRGSGAPSATTPVNRANPVSMPAPSRDLPEGARKGTAVPGPATTPVMEQARPRVNASTERTQTERVDRESKPHRLGVYAAAAAVAAVLVWVLFFNTGKLDEPTQESRQESTPPLNAAMTEPKPSPVERPKADSAPVRAEIKSQRQTPAEPKESTRSRVQERAATAGAGDWGVVAATYRSFALANKRAQFLKSKWQGGEVQVMPPEGKGQRYYVVLGAGMSKEEAERFLSRARRAGMPRDSYATKLAF